MSDNPNDDIQIPDYDAQDLIMAQAMFGGKVSLHPDILQVINTFGPMLFASCLFSMCEEYHINPDGPDDLIPRNNIHQAANKAIGMIRAVERAFNPDLDTLDEEVDQDTEIKVVKDV